MRFRLILVEYPDARPPPPMGPNHKCCAMNIYWPKYFTAVFGEQMVPSYRMDPQGLQSTSLVDLDLLV